MRVPRATGEEEDEGGKETYSPGFDARALCLSPSFFFLCLDYSLLLRWSAEIYANARATLLDLCFLLAVFLFVQSADVRRESGSGGS